MEQPEKSPDPEDEILEEVIRILKELISQGRNPKDLILDISLQ